MTGAPRHPITQHFGSRYLEATFRRDYAHGSLQHVRWAILLGIALYGPLFGAMDAVDAPGARHIIWTIRFGVCLVALGVYLFTFSRHFTRYMQPVLAGFLLLCGLGLVAMLGLEGTGQQYFDGPALIILAAYVVIRLRFVYATAVGWLTTVAYTIVLFAFRHEPADFLVSSIWFVISANIIGMFAAYELESYTRRNFWQARVLNAKRQELEVARVQATAQAAQLAELDAAKDRFFANVSHELRTPLTLLLGPIRDALDGRHDALDRKWEQHLPLMHRSGERLLGLVERLLDLARLDARRLRLRVVETDLVALVHSIVLGFAARAEREDVALDFDAEPEEVGVWIDPERVEQVLTNLLSNAFKFTPTGGRIRVSLRATEGAAVLTVRDTGEGIPPAVLPHIFERFRQADDTATRRRHGVGIGLALAHELVTLHGGRIEAESALGVGSTFTVRLPLGRAHFDEDAFASGPAQLPATTPTDVRLPDPIASEHVVEPLTDATVLVIDDHADMRAYLRSLLSPHYSVDIAEDGQSGLETARRLASEGCPPDLVVSDVMMPGLDGFAFCHALKEDEALGHIPVVLLTARGDEESKLEGLGEGADDYLAKPFSADELLARCENLIEVRRRLRARFSGEVVVRPTEVVVEREEVDWLEEVKEVCEAHLADAGFGVDWLADALDVSTRTLQRRLKETSGLTPGAFLRTMRLERAAQLLERDAESVSEVAAAVGYTDAESFSRAFRQGFGMPPTAYVAQRGPMA